MTGYKLGGTDLTELTAPADADRLLALDVSDTTTPPADADGSNKWMSLTRLKTYIGAGSGGAALYYNVKDYGAVGDGATDDTAAIEAAIAAALVVPAGQETNYEDGVAGMGTNTVFFPGGQYQVTATLDCTGATGSAGGYGVRLVGAGRQATSIWKNFTGPLLTFNGSGGNAAGNPSVFGGAEAITLDGGGNTGQLVQTASAQQMYFGNASFVNNPDVTLALTSLEDSYFVACTSNGCGSTTHRVIEIAGDADGTANMLYFIGLRVESFLFGAVTISAPSAQRTANGGNNGIYFTDYKFETTTVHGDIVTVDSFSQQVSFRDGFLAADSFASGYSTRANGISIGDASGTDSPGFNKIRVDNVSMYGSATVASVVKINGTNLSGIVRLDNIDCYDTPSAGIVSLTSPKASLVITGDAVPVLTAVSMAATGTTVTPSCQYMELTSSVAVTASTLAAGTVPGQQLTLANTGSNSIAITLGVLVAVTIATHTQHTFTWSANQSKWIG